MKISKKISKLLKITLLLCMMFTDLAGPIKVFADTIEPSYVLNVTKNTENKLVISSTGEKEVNVDDTYIIKVVRSFKYTDGSKFETKIEYMNVLGSTLNTSVLLDYEKNSYNGVSYVDVYVYEIVDKTIIEDLSTYDENDYKTLLDTDKVVDIMNASFEEEVNDNLSNITYNVTGDNVSCELDKCVVSYVEETEEVTDNNVYIDYILNKGDLNPNKKYISLIYINGSLYDIYSYEESLSINFMNLLSGVYDVRLVVKESDTYNEVLSSDIEFTYDNNIVEEDLVKYFSDIYTKDYVYGFISYTVLNEEEKDSLGNDYRFYDNRIAFEIDTSTNNDDSEVITNYNLYDNDVRYHVIVSNYFVGTFEKNDNTYTVGSLVGYLRDVINYANVYVTKGGNVVEDTEILENGMKVCFNVFGEIVSYDILVTGDVDGGLVEVSDISSLIDKILDNSISYYDSLTLDLNEDDNVDVADASLLGFNIYEGAFIGNDNDNGLTDTISAVIEVDDKIVRVGDKVVVTLKLDGFGTNYINAIDSLITYDKEALRLDSVSMLNEDFVGKNNSDRFIYASVETYDTNMEAFITLEFTALKEGNYEVSLNDIILVSDGVSFDKIDSNVLNIKVDRALRTNSLIESIRSNYGRFDKNFDSNTFDYTLYVDSYVSSVMLSGTLSDIYAKTDGFREYQLVGDNTKIEILVYAEDGSTSTYTINVVKVYKSSNNNLSNIVISGHEIEFDKDTLEYNIEVDSDVNELDISALVEDYRAWAKIEGNENFKTGKNVVTVKVYAEDGSTKTYTINVNKKEKVNVPVNVDTDTKEENNNGAEKTIIIILIVLVVIGLLYLIFKKDEEEEVRITEVKPKKDKNDKK